MLPLNLDNHRRDYNSNLGQELINIRNYIDHSKKKRIGFCNGTIRDKHELITREVYEYKDFMVQGARTIRIPKLVMVTVTITGN